MRLAVVLVFAGCGRVGFDTAALELVDGTPDTTPCTFGEFGAPRPVVELNTARRDWAPTVSSDGLTLIFSRDIAGNGQDLFIAKRSSTADVWDSLSPISELNSDLGEDDPSLSADGNELVFGDGSLQRSIRDDSGVFQPATTFFDDPQFAMLEGPELSDDGKTLLYNAARAGEASHLFIATRVSVEAPFTGFEPLDPDPDPTGDAGWPTLSKDRLELVFSSAHAGERDLWFSRRDNVADPFPAAKPLDALNAPGDDFDPELSSDGATIWFASDRTGDHDIYVATRSCQ